MKYMKYEERKVDKKHGFIFTKFINYLLYTIRRDCVIIVVFTSILLTYQRFVNTNINNTYNKA